MKKVLPLFFFISAFANACESTCSDKIESEQEVQPVEQEYHPSARFLEAMAKIGQAEGWIKAALERGNLSEERAHHPGREKFNRANLIKMSREESNPKKAKHIANMFIEQLYAQKDLAENRIVGDFIKHLDKQYDPRERRRIVKELINQLHAHELDKK